MRNFSASVFVLFVGCLQAQTAIIPFATQQPHWAFVFYVHDNTGIQDTLYYGYDAAASPVTGIQTADSVFGEKLVPLDTNSFAVACYESFSFLQDSISRVNITPFFNNYAFDLICWKARLPVTFRWNVSLLHSDSIPYVDQGTLPTGQIDFYWNGGNSTLGAAHPTCGIGDPIIITDTAIYSCNTIPADSLVVYDIFSDTSLQSLHFSFYINPWTGSWQGIEVISLEDEINIYPSPSDNSMHIRSTENILEITISSVSGEVIYNSQPVGNSNECNINSSTMESGIYILSLRSQYKTFSKKMIIAH